jgi:hypothetical protein
MLVRAIRLLSVVTITPVISVVVRLIRVIGFLRLYCYYIVIRVFNPGVI